jgi:hypothetical protein
MYPCNRFEWMQARRDSRRPCGLFRSHEIRGNHLRSTPQRLSRRAGAHETNRCQFDEQQIKISPRIKWGLIFISTSLPSKVDIARLFNGECGKNAVKVLHDGVPVKLGHCARRVIADVGIVNKIDHFMTGVVVNRAINFLLIVVACARAF